MRRTTRIAIAVAIAWTGACDGGSSARPPPPGRPTPPATPIAPIEAAPIDTATQPPAAAIAAPQPDPARADPLRARIQSDPDDASARCQLGWLSFEVGDLDGAEAETRRGIATLEARPGLPDARARETLAACLYDRGRIAEARARAAGTGTGLDTALADYARSLWLRDDATVREHWASLETELARTDPRPPSVPASLWTYAAGREREACGEQDDAGGESFGEDSTEGSCFVEIAAFARGREQRIAAVIAIDDVDDAGTPETTYDDRGGASYELVTHDAGGWIARGPVYDVDGSGSAVEVEVRYQDVQPGGEPEILVTIEDEWYQEGEGDEYDSSDSSGHHAELVVCGTPEGASDLVCASIVTRNEVHGEEEVVESCAVRFPGEGRVTIRGRMEGERVREETTVAELWQAELAARERARLEAERRAAAPPPPARPTEITGAIVPVSAPTEIRP